MSEDLANLVIDLLEAQVCGDPAAEPPGEVGFGRSSSLAKATMLRAVLLSSCLGAGRALLSASLAFFLEPHNAVTLIFLHLSCQRFELSIKSNPKHAITKLKQSR